MTARLTCHGGAGEVTGANMLLEIADKRFLIDCGILERESTGGDRNAEPFPYDPSLIDALFVTHAHADHIGRIPKLVRDGFRGTIYSTAATKDLSALMFDDALSIMAEEARLNPASHPLYERGDADRALSLWEVCEYHTPFSIGDVSIELMNAGHILGSAIVIFRSTASGRSIAFSGDLGNSPEPLLKDMEFPKGANYIVMESVYGDRVHEGREGRAEALRLAVEEARSRNGVLLIPSFSIERTQILLYELNAFIENGRMKPISIFLDAPLAIRVTEVYRRYKHLLNEETQARFAGGDDPFSFKGLTLTPTLEGSHTIQRAPNPKVIIAGSGMSHGGRIRAHEKEYLPDKHAALLFVGYQAAGSLGRRIEDGAKRIEIDGEHVRIRADVGHITGYSGHADRDGLLSFVEGAGNSLEKVFVAMGEPRSAQFLAQRIRDFLGKDAIVPERGRTFELDI